MYIGKVAERTGATPRAIRLYESQGLIPPPQRQGRYRVYNETEIRAIALIKRAQEAGFTLAELRSFINLKVRENRFPLELARELILHKRDRLTQAIEALKLTQQNLESLAQEIETHYA
jgi:DNA-binding transcriptional MerR regulator